MFCDICWSYPIASYNSVKTIMLLFLFICWILIVITEDKPDPPQSLCFTTPCAALKALVLILILGLGSNYFFNLSPLLRELPHTWCGFCVLLFHPGICSLSLCKAIKGIIQLNWKMLQRWHVDQYCLQDNGNTGSTSRQLSYPLLPCTGWNVVNWRKEQILLHCFPHTGVVHQLLQGH